MTGTWEAESAHREETDVSPVQVPITLICHHWVYNSVVVIRGITPGLSPGYENPTDG